LPSPNLEYVYDAAKAITHFLKNDDIVILESTCPVGTTKDISDIFKKSNKNLSSVHRAYCPERVLPGSIMKELVDNDRIVGGIDNASTKLVSFFYRSFVRGHVHETDHKTAEMCKLSENTFRDINIALANELSIICDKENIDIWNLIRLANKHPRVEILNPGVGVGGHCIAVDPWFIVSRDPDNSNLIKAGRATNLHKTEWVIEKIRKAIFVIEKKINKKPLTVCLGLTFKPNIDDLRESPSLSIVERLVKEGFNIKAVEPNIKDHNLVDIISFEDALNVADIIIVLVRHKEFKIELIKSKFEKSKILDFVGAI
jgi:UDP-N-acetyl-D-mannosaminuronic acid dehydrogenase